MFYSSGVRMPRFSVPFPQAAQWERRHNYLVVQRHIQGHRSYNSSSVYFPGRKEGINTSCSLISLFCCLQFPTSRTKPLLSLVCALWRQRASFLLGLPSTFHCFLHLGGENESLSQWGSDACGVTVPFKGINQVMLFRADTRISHPKTTLQM